MRLAWPARWRRRPPTRVVLHIGLPKCGSSSIQRHFAAHDAAYRRQGVVYPALYRSTRGYRSHRPLFDTGAAGIGARVAEIAAEAGEARAILLSCEAWSEYLAHGKGNGPALGAALAERFGAENVTVVAYVRAPLGYLASAYGQFLVGGLFCVPKAAFFAEDAAPGIGRFLDAAARVKGFERFDYLSQADEIAGAFPGLRVLMRSLEPGDLPGGDLIGDLCGLLGCRPAAGAAVRNTRKDAPSLLAIQHAQAVLPWDVFAPRRRLLRRFELSTAAAWSEADRRHRDLQVGPDLAARIRDRLEADRAALAARFSTPVAGLLGVPEVPALSERALSAAEKAEVLAAFQAPEGRAGRD